MEVEKPSNVAFGTESERAGFPQDVGHTRFGNAMNPITGVPNVGPGKYDIEQTTSMVYRIETRPVSTKGYTLGARCAPRIPKQQIVDTPAPGEYQPNLLQPFKAAYKPFNVAVERDPQNKRLDMLANPGPGTYEFACKRCPQVQYAQSFGGSPTDIPRVTQRSTIARNTEKLPTTREEKRYLRKLAYLKLFY